MIEKVSGQLESYSAPNQTSKIKHCAIADCIQQLTIFVEHFILDVSQGYDYASDKTKRNPGVLSFISQKISIVIFGNLHLNSILYLHCYLAERH